MIIVYQPSIRTPVQSRGGLNTGWSWSASEAAITYGTTLVIASPASGMLNSPSFTGGTLNDSDFGGNIA